MGIMSVQFLKTLPTTPQLILAFALLLLSLKWTRCLAYCLLGFIWASIYASSISDDRLQAALEGQEILITGQVVELPTTESRSVRFLFSVETASLGNDEVSFPRKMRLSWYGKGKTVRSGERWQLLVKLKRPHGLANPHGFDYEKWLFQQHIGATGYIRNSKKNKRIEESPRISMGNARESLKDYLDASLIDSPNVGVIKALVLGDRSGITTRQWEVFRHTGTSHLIAISGLHIGLVSALIFALVRWIVLRIPRVSHHALRFALIASVMAAGLYSALAGFSIPTQRALIMLSVVIGGVLLQRHYKPTHIISVALMAVLIYDPLALMSAGFWLSFGAVGVILYSVVGRLNRPSAIRQLFQIQWWVSIGLMPLVLYFFQQVSLVAPLANLLAVPFVSMLVVPLLMIAIPISGLSQLLGVKSLQLVDGLVGILLGFLEQLASVEFSYLSIPSVSMGSCVLAMVGVTLMMLPKGLLPRPLACFLFIPLFFPVKPNSLNQAEYELVLLDVGQGLSTVIHTANHTLVFDTGAKYSDKSDMALNVLIPYLKGKQISFVDTLIVSHGDNDHAGGVDTLLSAMKVGNVLTSVPTKLVGANPQACVEGLAWIWDGVQFQFLSPSKFNLFKGNNASCVLKISSINGSVLLTGDIEKHVERSLLQYSANKLKADVLIAPHHGSKTSSTQGFIEAVRPDYVLFPVGYRNRFGFPKQEVLKRYKDMNVKTLDSANDGALSVKFLQNKELNINTYRESSAMFWNWRQ